MALVHRTDTCSTDALALLPAPLLQASGNPLKVQAAKDMCVLYDSLQVRYGTAYWSCTDSVVRV
jgi:hypothetical protein